MVLDDIQKTKLVGLVKSDGWQVVLDILESICVEAENEYISIHPVNRAELVAQHSVMYAQRQMLEKFDNQVQTAVAEATGAQRPKKPLTRKEVIDKIIGIQLSDSLQ